MHVGSSDLSAAATEFRTTLKALGLTQHRVAKVFGVGARSIRRWQHGDRRIVPAIRIVFRLLAAKLITIDQIEQAAAPVPARTNSSAKEEPPAPLRAEPAPACARQAHVARRRPARAKTAALVEKIVALASDACRWPYGDPQHPDFHFCGKPTIKGSYCECHRIQAYLTPRHGVRVGFVAHWRQPRPQPAPARGRPSIPGALSATASPC
jgi:hypothetical protein